jgi:hypothetical protein
MPTTAMALSSYIKANDALPDVGTHASRREEKRASTGSPIVLGSNS